MIRKATFQDIEAIWQLRLETTQLLKSRQINQWQHQNPSLERFHEDIRLGHFFVYEGHHEVIGMMAIKPGDEPTYRNIYDGSWRRNDPYLTIHRLAVKANHLGKGIADELISFADCYALKNDIHYMRIDTHRNNQNAIRLFQKHGYILRGTIILDDPEGDPHRLAFDKIVEERHENLG